MKIDIPLLTASQIEARVSTVSEKGCSLLLYKDARCDMNILDEIVGATNWQRAHSRDNANCTVSIWDSEKSQWISKEDTGTESNTEKEKGLASDSFKRACFNWGIGRELYTAPFVWVTNVSLFDRNGKKTTNDKFTVQSIGYDESRNINSLIIKNQKGVVVYEMGKSQSGTPTTQNSTKKTDSKPSNDKQDPDSKITDAQAKRMYAIVRGSGKEHEESIEIITATLNHFGYENSKEVLVKDYSEICEALEEDGQLPF